MEIKNKTILLVEDEHITAIMGRKVLENQGFEVIHTSTGEDAVESVDSNPDIDLVLMDIDLGEGIDGTEAAEQILSRHDLPLVFLSSHTEPEIVNKTKNITNYGYVVKNTGEVVLIASIEMAFKLHNAHLREKEITEELQFQAKILDQIGDHVTATDLNGVIKYVNEAECKKIGKSKEEIIGQTTDIYGEDPESGASQKEILEATIKDRYWRGEVVNFDENNNPIVLDCRTWAMRDSNGNINNLVGVANDITERKKAEEQLKLQSEMLDIAPESITVHDFDGNLLYANKRTVELHGFEYDELLKFKLRDVEVPESHDLIESRMKQIKETGEATFKVEHFRKDGSVFPLEVHAKKIVWQGIPAILSIAADISFRKLVEQTLRESEEKFRHLFESSLEGILIVRGDTIEFANPALERIVGHPLEKLTSQPFITFVHPDDRDILIDLHLSRMKGEAVETGYEFRAITSDGTEKWVSINSQIIYWEGTLANLSFVTDINDRKLAEEALRESEALFRRIFDDHSAVMLLINPNTGRIINANQAAVKYYGYPPAKILQMKIQQMNTLLPQEISKHMHKASTKQSNIFEFRHMLADGLVRDVEVHSTPITIQNQTLLFSIIHDTTERKQAEEKLLLALKESDLLREKSEKLLLEKEIILKEAHHRIKNNMNTIYGILLLEAEHHDNSCSGVLQNAAGRVQSMMMLYEKLYQSETHIEINLHDFLKPLIDQIIAVHNLNKPVKANIKFDDIVLSPKILSSLGIIINELTTNSIKYAFAGKKQGIINVIATRENNLATLSYSDNGIGLPESFSIEESHTFGMQLVNMLVEQIKGTLRIDKGDGAGFVIEFDV